MRLGLILLTVLVPAVGAAQVTVVIKASPWSAVVNHPATSVAVDPGYKLLSGGGFDLYTGAGNLLDGTWPNATLTGWNVRGKDHMIADPARVTAYLVELYDPKNDYEVTVARATSPVAGGPIARVTLPAGYVMSGGGCFVNWGTDPAPGNLLRASYPDEASRNGWICESRDVTVSSPASIDAYVIGIRPRNSSWAMPTMVITKGVSTILDKPATSVPGASGYVVTGGGVLGVSNVAQLIAGTGRYPRPVRETDPLKQSAIYLTASYPQAGGANGRTPIGWLGSGKEHLVPSPGTVTTYAVNLKFPPPPVAPPAPPPPPPATCACASTGAFAAPSFASVASAGLTGNLTLPGVGTVTVQTQSISGIPQLDILDSRSRSVLSEANARAWGTSADGRYFLVAFAPPSVNASAPVSVYRVTTSPVKWPVVVGTSAYADGQWGFAPNPSLMLFLTRFQNGPVPFSAQVFNLAAGSPNQAVQNLGPSQYQAWVSSSPCGDLVMYFGITQLNPAAGQASFYRRTAFPNGSPFMTAVWDGTTPSPSASIASGGPTSFQVQLSGLTVRGTGATGFPSPQCTP